MTTIIAVLALLISLGSLAFGIYQYRILHRVRAQEKATSILKFAHDVRRKSEDLKRKRAAEALLNPNYCTRTIT